MSIYCDEIQSKLKEKTGKIVEVMIYGDGAFKDPVGKIWELADPIVSQLIPKDLKILNEIKLKYLADNSFADLKEKNLKKLFLSTLKINSLKL